MTDPASIPVTVCTEQSGENTSTVEQTQHSPVANASYKILVPLPEETAAKHGDINVSRLLRTPCSIAADRDGSVTITMVLNAPSDLPLTGVRAGDEELAPIENLISTGQAQIASIVDDVSNSYPSVSVHGTVVVGRLSENVMEQLTADDQYDELFIPRSEDTETTLWDRSLIEEMIDATSCAIYVENVGTGSEFHRPEDGDETTDLGKNGSSSQSVSTILLAVGTGAHSVLGAEAARALARECDAKVNAIHLYSTATDQDVKASGEDALSVCEYVLSDIPNVTCTSREVDHVVDDLLREIEQHDVAVMGAPTKQLLVERVFKTGKREKDTMGSSVSVVMARQPSDAMNTVYYRWKRAIERTVDEESSGSPTGGVN